MLRQPMKKIIKPELDIHLVAVSNQVVRVTMTEVGVAIAAPTIGVRPELADRMAKAVPIKMSSATETVEIMVGGFVFSWKEGCLTIKEYGAGDKIVAVIEEISLLETKPSCIINRLGSNKVYGCGEKYGWINKVGTTTVNWNTDVMGLVDLHHGLQKEYHTAIPFFMTEVQGSSQSFVGYYFDNSWRTYFDFDKGENGYFEFKADGGSLDFYLIQGNTIGEVVRRYSDITGTMPMPRLDFLGYQQCRWSYMNQKEVLEIASEMRKHRIPCDVMYLDIDYMKDYKVFTIDRDRFPDFKGMNDQLKGMGFKTVAIIDPGVKAEKGYGVYDRGLEQGAYVKSVEGMPYVGEVWPGRSVYPDFLNEQTRRWWGQEHGVLFQEGVDGIWNDMNEPADFTAKSKTIPETCLHKDDKGQLISHSEVHNLYATYEAKATYEAMCQIKNSVDQDPKRVESERPFILTRSASAGAQRYTAIWTGDNSSLWEHLESSIPMLLNLGLSGYAYSGGDVGGFLNDGDGELLARWTQLGAFMPLFRNHSAMDTLYQEPWRFGEPILSITKSAIELRYTLLTYLYQQMHNSHLSGDPIMRPLFYEAQGLSWSPVSEVVAKAIDSEENLWNINDQFLYGPDLMVCPVVRPHLTKRSVYFPVNQNVEGGWYDFYSKERYTGGTWAIVDAPLDKIPVFVREGALVPRDLVRTSLPKKNAFQSLTIELYGADQGQLSQGTAHFYFDDGLSREISIENSVVLKVSYEVERAGNVVVTTSTEGSYPLPKLNFVWKGSGGEKTIRRYLE